MGVDIIDLGRVNPGISQGHLHGPVAALGAFGWRRDVIGIARQSIA